MPRININWRPTGMSGLRMGFEKTIATEITEHTEKILCTLSVFSDGATSHSTMLAKDASQAAGYVAKRG